MGQNKHCILLLNKADLLSPDERAAWAEWLTAHEIRFLFWSANAAMDAEEGMGEIQIGPYSTDEDVLSREQLLHHLSTLGRTICKAPITRLDRHLILVCRSQNLSRL